MAFSIGFGKDEQTQEQRFNRTDDQFTRQSGRSQQDSTRTIGEAGQLESSTVSQLMQQLMGNMGDARGLVTGGIQDSIQTAAGEYDRLINKGAKSALGVMGKSGMKSSLVNNLMGAVQEGAAGQLAGNMMNLQATMPLQALNAVNATSSPIMQMLQGYFLNERGQNVSQSQTGSQTGSQGSTTQSSGTTNTTGTNEQTGVQIGS